jgi:hypothetical protein
VSNGSIIRNRVLVLRKKHLWFYVGKIQDGGYIRVCCGNYFLPSTFQKCEFLKKFICVLSRLNIYNKNHRRNFADKTQNGGENQDCGFGSPDQIFFKNKSRP